MMAGDRARTLDKSYPGAPAAGHLQPIGSTLFKPVITSFHLGEVPQVFVLILISLWLISLTPQAHYVQNLMGSTPSLIWGALLGFWLLGKRSPYYWVATIILIVFAEQIFIVSRSFGNEVILIFMVLQQFTPKAGRRAAWWGIALFTLACVVSAIWNFVPAEVTIAGVRSYIQYAIMFVCLYSMPFTTNDEKRILNIVLYSGLIFSSLAIVNIVMGNLSYVGRAESVLSNPNAVSGFLLFMLPILVINYLLPHEKKFIKHAYIKAFYLIILVAFVSTGSRAAILGATTALVLVIMIGPIKISRYTQLLVIFIFAGVIGSIATGGKLIERFNLLADADYMSVESNVRSYYSVEGMKLFWENPILGVGPGRYGGSVATIFPSPVYQEYNIRSPKEWAGITQSDIFYPHLFAELGFIGSAIFMYLVLRPIILWLMMALKRRARWTSNGAIYAAGCLSLVFASVGGPYFELHLTAVFFWLYLFLLVRDTRATLTR